MVSNSNSKYRDEDRPVKVEFREDMLQVTLKDGRLIATPLTWYPSLAAASPGQQGNYELGLTGIHWPDLDEDLSVAGMLQGNRPPQRRRTQLQKG